MKMKELIEKVDRSEKNSSVGDIEEFAREVGVETYLGWHDEFAEKVKGYYLVKWYCTDTWVGLQVHFMDDEPIAISMQKGRKCDKEYEFLSVEAAEKVRKYILSLVEEDKPTYNIVKEDDLEEEMGEFYHVEFASQLLVKEGFVDGKPCKVIKEGVGDIPWKVRISQQVIVQFEDGSTETVSMEKFDIPYHITK